MVQDEKQTELCLRILQTAGRNCVICSPIWMRPLTA